jgi:hypothetical protein
VRGPRRVRGSDSPRVSRGLPLHKIIEPPMEGPIGGYLAFHPTQRHSQVVGRLAHANGTSSGIRLKPRVKDPFWEEPILHHEAIRAQTFLANGSARAIDLLWWESASPGRVNKRQAFFMTLRPLKFCGTDRCHFLKGQSTRECGLRRRALSRDATPGRASFRRQSHL